MTNQSAIAEAVHEEIADNPYTGAARRHEANAMALTPTQKDFVTRYLGVRIADARSVSSPEGSATVSVPVKRLGKSRIEWGMARRSALGAIPDIKTAIRETFLDTPKVQKQVDAGIAILELATAQITGDLDTELDKVLQEPDAGDRATLAIGAAKMARQYQQLLRTDPIISAIDGTAVLPGIRVIAPMVDRLNDLLGVLAQIEADAASQTT